MNEKASCLNKYSVLFILALYAGIVCYVLSIHAIDSMFYNLLCLFASFVVTPVFIWKYYSVLKEIVNNKYLIWVVVACFIVTTCMQTHYLSSKYEIYPEYLIFSVGLISIKDTAIAVYVIAIYGLGIFLMLKHMIENNVRPEYFGLTLFLISVLVMIFNDMEPSRTP